MKQNFNIFIVLYNYMICIKGPYVSDTLMPRDMFVYSYPKFANEFWDSCFTDLLINFACGSLSCQVGS